MLYIGPTLALINNQEDRLGEYAAMRFSGQQQWKDPCNRRSQSYTTDWEQLLNVQNKKADPQSRACLSFVPSGFEILPVEFRRIVFGYSFKNLTVWIEISIQLPKVSLTKLY